MKKFVKAICVCALSVFTLGALALGGCTDSDSGVYVTDISLTATDGALDTYTVTYSNGTTTQFQVNNGAQTTDEEEEEQTATDHSQAIQTALTSTLTVYTEYDYTYTSSMTRPGSSGETAVVLLGTGSGVIYAIDDDYTYILTNYHVIYDSTTVNSFGRAFHVYLYGSWNEPEKAGTVGSYATSYIYDDYAIECDYIGGSAISDVAVLRASTDDVHKVNPDVTAVTFAESYSVGESVFAVGNAEGYGISVTEGIISVDNEYIEMNGIDGTTREYRSIRMDAVIYSGNSGGGLFNKYGQLVGLVNAASSSYDSINYSIPFPIVKNTAENILHYFENGTFTLESDMSDRKAQTVTFGLDVSSENARYVYDSEAGRGEITEDVYLSSVTGGSIAESMGLEEGDYLLSVTIGGTQYGLSRTFTLSDLILTMRAGDAVSFNYRRDGLDCVTEVYTISQSDLSVRT